MRYTKAGPIGLRRGAFGCLVFLLMLCVDAMAQQSSLCTMTVQLPPAAGRGQAPPAGGPGVGRGGARGAAAVPNAAAEPAALPKLVKVKDDVYVIQNQENTVAQIGTFGGNVTIYLTNDGVILFDSKNEQMHDDVFKGPVVDGQTYQVCRADPQPRRSFGRLGENATDGCNRNHLRGRPAKYGTWESAGSSPDRVP